MTRPSTPDDLRAHIRATPIAGDPPAMRDAFARRVSAAAALPRTEIGGVACAVFGHERHQDGEGTLLWLHGGGLVMGAPESHAVMLERLAGLTGLRVVAPAYALAPEAPWPAQRDACRDVLSALPGPVHLGGDSAGGQIALILAQRLTDRIATLSLVSPNTDRTGLSTTRARDTDLMNDGESDAAFARQALGDYDPADPEVSPLLGPLDELPPLLVVAAGAEVLLDDALLLVHRAALADASVSLRVFPGLFHLFPLWPDILPQGDAALRAIAAHIAEGAPSPRPA
ncbi:alpha/beta hydrolase [Palleronia sediminis]|uniref:Alpha/beta hydrolase n=1 Tax=Palleronia sediminis TaxID=2547833 RepID=A0A4R5ZXZ5_9RHOB|nr:alpha/beta hydrolase fold domain-containing protein [Palleronia sediminis]TDL76061.1 alpha/beta hydrolase [Palleronia sediminis]